MIMLLYLYDNLYITFEIKYSNHEHIYLMALIIIYYFVHPSANVLAHVSNLIVFFFFFSKMRITILNFSISTNTIRKVASLRSVQCIRSG